MYQISFRVVLIMFYNIFSYLVFSTAKMPGPKRRGKTLETLKRLTKQQPALEIERQKIPKIIIDKTFVDSYTKAQKNRKAVAAVPDLQSQATIVIDSSDDEEDVIFVRQFKKPENSPKTQIKSMQKELSILKRRNQILENRCNALQSTVSNNQSETEDKTENAEQSESIAGLNIYQSMKNGYRTKSNK